MFASTGLGIMVRGGGKVGKGGKIEPEDKLQEREREVAEA